METGNHIQVLKYFKVIEKVMVIQSNFTILYEMGIWHKNRQEQTPFAPAGVAKSMETSVFSWN
jgi:hypothetical protein